MTTKKRNPAKSERCHTPAEMLELALVTLSDLPGQRNFRLATELMGRAGCSRRSAIRWLARAREHLSEHATEAVEDIVRQLPEWLGGALMKARESDNIRAITQLLTLVASMRAQHPEADTGGEGDVSGIDFEVVGQPVSGGGES